MGVLCCWGSVDTQVPKLSLNFQLAKAADFPGACCDACPFFAGNIGRVASTILRRPLKGPEGSKAAIASRAGA